MNQTLALIGLPTATLLLTAFLLTTNIFQGAVDVLDKAFGAAPKWTQVQNMVHDPATQDLSHGEKPKEAFLALEQAWAEPGDARRVMVLGNSQTMAISLAPGEGPSATPERAWVDLLARQKRAGEVPLLVYRSSTAGLSYTEALWYTHYLASHPAVRPDALVLQLNYQSFWNGGVREGLLEMLDDGAFRKRIEAEAASAQPYSDTFVQAIRAHTETRREKAGSIREDTPPGMRWDGWVRQELEAWPPFAQRAEQRTAFAELLYRLRVYVLKLTPATARTISGTRWNASCAAIESIARICRESGIRLVLFSAPVNPKVNLYRTPEDRETYRKFVHSLEAADGVRVHDLENTIPQQYWGMWLTLPDPLHLGREGHQLMANQMSAILSEELAR